MVVDSSHDAIIKFVIKTWITQGWCWLTNAEAVFIADSFDKSKFRYVKVARVDDTHPDKWRKICYRKFCYQGSKSFNGMFNFKIVKIHFWLDPDKTILMSVNGANYSNNWFYVNIEKRVEQILRHDYAT